MEALICHLYQVNLTLTPSANQKREANSSQVSNEGKDTTMLNVDGQCKGTPVRDTTTVVDGMPRNTHVLDMIASMEIVLGSAH